MDCPRCGDWMYPEGLYFECRECGIKIPKEGTTEEEMKLFS